MDETKPQAADPVYLYILMRQDLASMNPGKAVAQGAHAANQMVFSLIKQDGADPSSSEKEALYQEWSQQTPDGFGTTITLGCTEAQMRRAIEIAKMFKMHCGITHDPTYPLVDGDVLHLLPLDTCAFILVRKSAASFVTNGMKLMP